MNCILFLKGESSVWIMWCLNLSLWLHALFFYNVINLQHFCWYCLLSFLPLILVPSTFSVLVLVLPWRARSGNWSAWQLTPTKKEINYYFSYLVWLAVQLFGWYYWHEGDIERKWLRGRNSGGGQGNASYSRETDLYCVKINLHEIEWHNWYLFGEKIIFKAEETSGPSTWAA